MCYYYVLNCSTVQMGCYGIGVSRILAAAVEYGCAHQSESLVWPRAIAPYTICVTPMANVCRLINRHNIRTSVG